MPSVRTAVWLALLALAGCQPSRTIEWQEIAAERGRIVFDMRGLAGMQRQTLWRESPYTFAQEELTYWYTSKTAPPAAQILMRSLPPGYAFTTVPELRDMIEGFGADTGRAVQLGAEARAVNALGPIDHRAFRLGEAECVAFREVTGRSVRQPDGMYVPTGDTILLGYYCAQPGQRITPEVQRAVLQAVDLKPENARGY